MNNSPKYISCIIPAFNEANRIRSVLDVVVSNPLVKEVIVVDDGSKDETKEIVAEYGVKMIVHDTNKGKSASLYDGIRASSGDYIMFIDADLVGLKKEDISNLSLPILNNDSDVSISLRKNAPGLWHWIGVDYISGERIIPRSLIVSEIEKVTLLRPFGFEVFLNRLIIKNRLRIRVVNWPNVESPYKVTKNGVFVGLMREFKMIIDIVMTVSLFGPFVQIYRIKKLMVKNHE